MYGKMTDGHLIQAPEYIVEGERTIYNPCQAVYKAHGWKRVIEAPCPAHEDESVYYESVYTEKDGDIIQSWVEAEPPEAQPSLREQVDLLLEAMELLLSGETEEV